MGAFDFSDPALTTPLSQFNQAPPPGGAGAAAGGVPPLAIPVGLPPAPPPQAAPPAPPPPAAAPPPVSLPPPTPMRHAGAGPAAAPAAPPPPAFDTGPIAGAAADLRDAGHQQETALAAQGAAEQPGLDRQAAAAQQNVADQAALVAEHKKQMDAVQARLDDARKQRDDFKYHDYWQNKPAAARVVQGFAILLGGLSRHPGEQNEALKIIQDNINKDLESQRDTKKGLFQAVESAQGDVSRLSSQQLQDVAIHRQQEADKITAIVKQSEAMAARSKNDVGVAAVRQVNAKLGLEAAQAEADAQRAAQAAAQKAVLDKSEISLRKSEEAKNYATAAKERAGAAGAKSQVADEQIAKLGARLYPQQATAIKDVAALNDAQNIQDQLKSNPSALTGKLAQEAIAKLAAGTRPSQALFKGLGEAGGSWADLTEDKLQKAFTGKNGATVRKSFINAMDDIIREKQAKVESHKKNYDAALSGLSKRNPDFAAAVQAHKTGIFGADKPVEQPQWKPATAAMRARDPNAKEVLVDSSGKITGVR